MRVAITGATGFIGRKLIGALRQRGDAVLVFSRDPARATRSLPSGVEAVSLAEITGATLSRVDAVINLAGEPVAGGRWSEARKREILRSRVEVTRAVVAAIAAASPRPAVLLNASAVGFYGPRGDEAVTEGDAAGVGFLSDVCRAWESEAERATSEGVRVVRLRIGVVLGDAGGPLEAMALPFKLFAGGPVGDGRQWLPWVHVDDVVGLALYALDHDAVRGAVNATAPEPVRFGAFAKALGAAMRRPSWLKVPAFALRLAVGEMADVLLTGQRAVPKAALDAGYRFHYASVGDALRAALAAENR